MGVLPAVFDLDAGGRSATRSPVARTLQCAALDDSSGLSLADVSDKLSAVESGLRPSAAVDSGGRLRSDGARFAHDSAGGGRAARVLATTDTSGAKAPKFTSRWTRWAICWRSKSRPRMSRIARKWRNSRSESKR